MSLPSSNPVVILGIDPGSTRIGYGVIRTDQRPTLLTYGTIEIRATSTAQKLQEAVQKIGDVIREFQPECVAIETIYFAKNRKTGIAVAQTRGALIAEAQRKNCRVYEYDPTTIKKTVAGHGFADKKSVAKIISLSLGIDALTGHDDASDAVAVALTAAYHLQQQERLDTQ